MHSPHLQQCAGQVRTSKTERQYGKRLGVMAYNNHCKSSGETTPSDREGWNFIAVHSDQHARIGREREEQTGTQGKQESAMPEVRKEIGRDTFKQMGELPDDNRYYDEGN